MGATITDESNGGLGTSGNGGLLRFLSGSYQQQLIGGYNAVTRTGPVFQHLQLQNPLGVELLQTSARISKTVDFKSGLFFLADQTLVVGNNNPGVISGYDSSRYFVTGAAGGLLVRENIRSADGWVTFPVGSKPYSYTPLSLRARSTQGDDFHASVADQVFSGLTSGNLLADEGVGKTWHLGKRLRPGQGDVEVALQHLASDEGIRFTNYRSKAYVSQFTGGAWDVGYPQLAPVPGTLTTGGVLNNSGVNSRVLTSLGNSSYLTKFTGDGDTSKTKVWFNAYRLDRNNVYVYWTTRPEVNVKYFIVQRMLTTETTFRNVATVNSKAANGFSLDQLHYNLTDPNSYTGVSFYRLVSVNYDNTYGYHNIVAVGGVPGRNEVVIWPNPSRGVFYVALNTRQEVQKLILWNAAGQKVMEVPTNGLRVVPVMATHLTPGTYLVSLAGRNDGILETHKVIIADK